MQYVTPLFHNQTQKIYQILSPNLIFFSVSDVYFVNDNFIGFVYVHKSTTYILANQFTVRNLCTMSHSQINAKSSALKKLFYFCCNT